MSVKDRDYDDIISGCEQLISALEELGAAGKALSAIVASVEVSLKDDVGTRDVQGASEIAKAISEGMQNASPAVSELKTSIQNEKNDFEELCRR